ncbi:hypothetical protein [Salinarimonas sp.]|uniref:hypothetical protein n=1 Tax=Salinarimonas sp. TaxID=2766526 RepID=UPI0032D94440
MNELVNALWRHITSFEEIDTSTDGFALTFMALTFVVAFFAVVLDICYAVVRGESFLGLKHGLLRSVPHLLFWPIGAAVFAWFGLAMGIIQPTILGAVAAATVWTFSIRRAVASMSGKADADDAREED